MQRTIPLSVSHVGWEGGLDIDQLESGIHQRDGKMSIQYPNKMAKKSMT